jgi:two-component system chemotaxis response regulator CheB
VKHASTLVRVVVVEDSAVQRAHLVRTLEADGDIDVVGVAEDAREAVALVDRVRPDVVTLDLEIPEGGGQHAIEQIMGNTPTPILVLSAFVSGRESARAVDALVAGAVEALPKPQQWTPADEAAVRRTVRSIRGVTVVRHPRGRLTARPRPPVSPTSTAGLRPRIVGIAASTGGPPALAEVLAGLDGLRAPVLVVQHLHADFIGGLVTWMGRVSVLPVRLAEHGAPVEPGTVYVGPGDRHLRLDSAGSIELAPEPATIHRPSADELFRSIAEHAGGHGIGVVLTGMGEDGAAGLRALYEAGGVTLAQDEASSAVFGMPRAAQRAGALTAMLPLDEIAPAILRADVGALR